MRDVDKVVYRIVVVFDRLHSEVDKKVQLNHGKNTKQEEAQKIGVFMAELMSTSHSVPCSS